MRIAAVPVAKCALLLFALAGMTGCGGTSQPDVGLVTGTVTMDGQPLENAAVVFSPTNGRPSMGITDSSGQYELTYIRDTKGAIPGTHQVRITTVEESVPDDYSGPAFRETIPIKYNAETTLVADVKPGENTFDFELESR